MKLKTLVQMMVLIPVIIMPATTALHASDLTLYKGNTTGKTSILLMLDTSGSMGISSLVLPKNNKYGSPGDVNSSLCSRTTVDEANNSRSAWYKTYEWAYNLKDLATNKTAIRKTVSIGGTAIPYYVRGCSKNGLTQYDRLSRLKDAILPLLASNELSNDVLMGLGQFSSKTELTIGTATNRLTDGHSGRILVPNAPLTSAQRIKIAREIAAIKSLDTSTDEDGTPNTALKLSSDNYPNVTKASSGTPTAHAYAEAAAYMMGTGTGAGGGNSGRIDIIYDGYMVKQQAENDGQVYFICTEAAPPGDVRALGASVIQCPSDWPDYNSVNKTASSTTIYKPNGSGGWTQVSFNDFKTYVAANPTLGGTGGVMGRLWDVYKNLPIGWRFDGWMRVDNEPMDIEPIVGTVWTYGDNIRGLVSYRTNPFSIASGTTTTTTTVQGFQNCPSGSTILSSWTSLCIYEGPFYRRATSSSECINDGLIKGQNPISDARDPSSGNPTPTESYNRIDRGLVNLRYVNNNNSSQRCVQDRYAVARPWGPVTQTITTTGPVDNNIGGMAYSAFDTKKTDGSNTYAAGGSTSSCDGNGIYMLTDGAPNSTKDVMARTIMNKSLNDNATYTFTAKPTGGLVSPSLQSNLFDGEIGGWEYIGAYAKKMRNRTDSSNTQKNPVDMNIKTAVVGFGASFSGLSKNADGTYDCSSAPNDDAKNACLWGSAAYGDGGFYYAENSEDIKNSIIKFVQDVTVTFPPSSLGTISIPRDPLDQTRIMPTGFFPMILPQNDSSLLSWAGNLKKYNVVGGTLKDSSGNAIYTQANNQQTINSGAKDLWSISGTGSDHSLVNSGGAWNKIPVPSTLNVTGEPSKADSIRNVFTLDGTNLRRVTKENLATDYTGSTPVALNTTNINVEKRYNLLNYLGYKATTNTSLTTAQVNSLAVVPSSPYRYLGGVVHSTPLVLTDLATLNSSGNGVESRTEYVVYGSMDGGLHIVDANTGTEKSVFVPKEVLNNQNGKTLANSDFKATGTLSYGVDAPWTADNTFKVVSTTSGGATTTKYESTRMNIYGGLRMGGSALYGLDIKTPTSPSLLFHITSSTTGFSRMGQIWSKPTLANIRIKGERKRVLIFGGGYDASVYEKEAPFIEPTTATKGNAIYIVDANDGTLLWMASSDTSGITDAHKKTVSSEMLYSVTGQPVVRDYDADGLADMIYFADLGGQIFRVDLNNAEQAKTTDINVGVRVKRIANLRTGSDTTEFVPRFYERLTTAIFGNGASRFVLVTAGSGNRSFPLEASSQRNKIYGIFDYDAATKGIENISYTGTFKAEATESNLLSRGILGKTSTTISNWGTGGSISDDKAVAAMGPTGAYRGWTFDLSSGSDISGANYSKSFEESQLVSGDLYVNVYDSKAVLGGGTANACGGGVQGLSTTHRICAPYGDCAAYVKQDYQGILGPVLGLKTEGSRTSSLVGSIAATEEACVGKCSPDKTTLTDQNLYQYAQSRKIKPTKWYER